MKFNEKDGVILISGKELVKTARRGISQSVPLDEDDVKSENLSLLTKKKILGTLKETALRERVVIGEYTFEIVSSIDGAAQTLITKIFYGDIRPKKPRKEQKAQARGEAFIFGYLYLKKHGYKSLTITTVYVNKISGEFEKYTENVSKASLEAFFEKCIHAVSVYARPEIERVTQRVPSMRALRFPYKAPRQAQREFIASAHRALVRGGTLFATAPTGTGKTVSALYPAVRAMGEGKISKCFYLTPKATTALAAKECIELFCKQKVTIKAIIITAKDKICINRSVCRQSKSRCKYLESNNVSKAVMELYNSNVPVVTYKEIQECAENYAVCPYELSLSYSELCDVVICDFNYLFDTDVYIRRYFDEGGDYAFLIDEAHNLPDRAREMYSSEISDFILSAPLESELISEHSDFKKAVRETSAEFHSSLYPFISDEIHVNENGEKSAFAHLKEIPPRLHSCIEKLLSETEDALFRSYSQTDSESEMRTKFIREYAFRVKNFYQAICRFSDSYELFIFYENGSVSAKIFCIDTGADILERLNKGRGAVFFSATLSPLYYYKSVLGNDSTSEILTLPSPFDSSQLSVSIMDKISTRFSEREDTLTSISRAIAATVSAKRGKYMIFSPSFEYNERLYKIFKAKYPKIQVILQTKGMTKKEKDGFLSKFKEESSSYLIGFCVMGGIYSEGIDLAGDSLIGAVIVGIGMPSLSYEREAIQSYYDEKYEEGRQFAYLYPGLNRVLQAAGRVIRREDDRGVIVLIDDRFRDPLYKKTIPTLWSGMKFISSANELNERLKEFWQSVENEKKYNSDGSVTD